MTQAFNLGQLANKVNTSGQLNASTGLVNSVAVANGGTGRATLTSGAVILGAGTSQVSMVSGSATNDVLAWSGSAWVSTPAASAGGGGGYIMTAYTSPATWTKPVGLKSIKVTIVGGGGTGGSATETSTPGGSSAGGGGGGGTAYYYAPAVSLSPTVAVTAGAGTNSFGALASATAGAAGTPSGQNQTTGGGAGGTGSGGTVNVQGWRGTTGGQTVGGATTLSGGQGQLYGGGGAGGSRVNSNGTTPGTAGVNGIIIIEEFY